jgi:hypothetical protein
MTVAFTLAEKQKQEKLVQSMRAVEPSMSRHLFQVPDLNGAKVTAHDAANLASQGSCRGYPLKRGGYDGQTGHDSIH